MWDYEKITIEFNEQPERSSATDARNYRIEPKVQVRGISLEGRYGKTVVISVAGLQEDSEYTLRVSNVKDRGGNAMKSVQKSLRYVSSARPLVELLFNEGRGREATNTGTAREPARLTAQCPSWSSNTPPAGGSHSLDFGTEPGVYAVDLPEQTSLAMEGLKSFTITAWINRTSDREGRGGNRIVHMADTLGGRAGIDLVVTRDGRLKIGVNEWTDSTQAATAADMIPADGRAGKDNWRFMAVSYDSGAATEHMKPYIGTPTADARLYKAFAYDRGAVGAGAGIFTVGNFNPALRAHHTDRIFRGLIDEVRLFGSRVDGSGALPIEQILAVQKAN